MNHDDRKSVALTFWKMMGELRFDEAEELLAPDAVFCARGTPDKPLSRYFPLICDIYRIAPIIHHEVKVFVEGDDVSYNAKGSSVLPNGIEYNNDYVFMMVIRENGISSIREYSDTAYAGAVLFPCLSEPLIKDLLSG